MIRERYINKENRNTRAKELKAQGYIVKCSSARNIQLHPEYIKDYKEDFETGLGNRDYQILHKAIYTLETQ